MEIPTHIALVSLFRNIQFVTHYFLLDAMIVHGAHDVPYFPNSDAKP